MYKIIIVQIICIVCLLGIIFYLGYVNWNAYQTTQKNKVNMKDCQHICIIGPGVNNFGIWETNKCVCCDVIPVGNLGNVSVCEIWTKTGNLTWIRE